MLKFRFATEQDADIYFRWANDPDVRKNSFTSEPIGYDYHLDWFRAKIQSSFCHLYLFLSEENIPAGQVRIDQEADETVISVSVDKDFRGKSLGTRMVLMACGDFMSRHPGTMIDAYVKEDNFQSLALFRKAGFGNEERVTVRDQKSIKFRLSQAPVL